MKTLEGVYPIAALCEAFAVSRSGYYRWRNAGPTARASEDARLTVELKTLHRQSRGTYGRPRLLVGLRENGEHVSGRRVSRLMKSAGLRGVRRGGYRPRTTNSRHRLTSFPNLVRQAPAPQRPDQVWVGDITYIPTREGWLYVAGVLDRCSRRMVGLAMGPRLDASLPVAALRQALTHRGPVPCGLIHHSDQGVQYASILCQDILKKHGLISSMSRKAHCEDNAHMESFWGTLKAELMLGRRFKTRAEARLAIFEYVEVFYNRVRLHSALGYQSPVDFEANLN
jgi:transposase InsO family protein